MIHIRKKTFHLFILILFIITSNLRAQYWNETNGPSGGIIEDIITDHSGMLFTAVYRGGIFKSSDSGNSWIKSNEGIPTTYVYSISVDSQNNLYAGTYIYGIFKSTNRGESWVNILQFPEIDNIVWDIEINSSGHLFAATELSGIWRSTDNGVSWSQVNQGILSNSIMTLGIDSDNRLFCGTIGAGIYRSSDNGNTWINVTNEITCDDIISLAVTESNDIFAGTRFGKGIFKSTNNGNSWQAINSGLPLNWATNVLSIFSAPGSVIYAGIHNKGIYKSTDNGASWIENNSGLTADWIFSFAASQNGDIFAGTHYEGIFKSSDGSTWNEVNNGIRSTWIISMNIDDQDGVYGAVFGRGIYKTTNNGDEWYEINNGITTPYILDLISDENQNLYVGSYDGQIGGASYGEGIFKSTDNGNSWNEANAGITSHGVRTLSSDKTHGILYAGTFNSKNLYKSTDQGQNWIEKDAGLPLANILAITVNEQNGNVFVGFDNGGIYRSSDYGDSWNEINNGFFVEFLNDQPSVDSFQDDQAECKRFAKLIRDRYERNSLAKIVNSPELLLIPGVNDLMVNPFGEIFAATTWGIFKSTDNGNEWHHLDTSNGLLNVTSIISNSKGTLFAASHNQIFQSIDNGFSWKEISNDFFETSVKCFALNSSENLFVGTGANGVFYSNESTLNENALIEIDFVFSDAAGQTGILTAGLDPFASDGIDSLLGEIVLPFSPPPGTFEAVFILPDSLRTHKDIRYGDIPFTGEVEHIIEFQVSTGSTMTIEWTLPDGIAGNLKNYPNGNIHNFSFNSGYNTYTVNDADIDNKFILTLYYDEITPVELSSFTASANETTIILNWKTVTETNNYGFEIERSYGGIINGNYNWTKIGFIRGSGTTTSTSEYNFVDNSITSEGKYFYRIKMMDMDGSFTYSSIIDIDYSIADEFILSQNYPNPFNPSTKIKFTLPYQTYVKLSIYNSLGETVTVLTDEILPAGNHEYLWNAVNIASGVYYYRLESGNFSRVMKMMLVK